MKAQESFSWGFIGMLILGILFLIVLIYLAVKAGHSTVEQILGVT